MKSLLVPGVAGVLALVTTATAQTEMPGSPAGVNAALTKLFGEVKAFSAKAEVRVLDKDQKEKVTTPMDFALLDGKLRVEVDIGQIKSEDMSPTTVARMKQFGMDRVVSIIRPDKQTSHIVFPGMQAYVNTPLTKEDLKTYEKSPKIEKTTIGKESLDGHACVKNKVIMTDDRGRKYEAVVWNAADLEDFPVQIQTKEESDTVVLRYRRVQLTKPDAKEFEPPAGFKSYSDMQALMQGVMMKVMNNGGARSQ